MLALDLQQELEQMLQQELDAIAQSQNEAQSGMTHAESRAENDKDTRAIESSYLARGLAQRVAELKASLATIQAWKLSAPEPNQELQAGLGRIVSLCDEDQEEQKRVWLAPTGGGLKLVRRAPATLVLTPSAPLGQALIGKGLDDEITVQSPSGSRVWLITDIEA